MKFIKFIIVAIFAVTASSAFAAPWGPGAIDCSVPADLATLGTGTASLNVSDCQFLEALYVNTAGASWTDTTGWGTATEAETWIGVDLTAAGTHLSVVSLTNNNLVGSLAGTVLPTELTALRLSNNDLTGDVGSWVLPSTLVELNVAVPASTGLSGDISGWVIPSTMEFLQLPNNSFSGDISGWVISPVMNQLNIGQNTGTALTGDISGWSLPTTLTRYQVNSNGFTGDITNLISAAGLPNLVFADLHANGFTGDISGWTFGTSLSRLQAYSNTALAGDLSGWVLPASLTDLRINNNDHTGDLSSWVLPSTALRMMLSSNAFSGDIPDFGPVTAMNASLSNIDFNQFTFSDAGNNFDADADLGENWSTTQTVAPVPEVSVTGTSSVDVTAKFYGNTAINYEYSSVGDYITSYGTTMGGPYTVASTTTARSAGAVPITGLMEDTVYYGQMVATTPANGGGNVLTATSSEFLIFIQSAPDLTDASDTGPSNSDDVTSQTLPTFTGDCIDGAVVEVYVDGVATGDTATCTAGVFTITLTSPLAIGSTYDITFDQVLTGYTQAQSPALAVTLADDSTFVQQAPDLVTASDTGASNSDNITSDLTPTFTENCLDGAIVEMYVDGVATGDTATCTAGVFTITLTSPLALGATYDITYDQVVTGYPQIQSPVLMISTAADPVISSGGGGGGSSTKACRDEDALNYKSFGKSTPSLCEYATETTVTTTTTTTTVDREDLFNQLKALLAQLLAERLNNPSVDTCPYFTQYMKVGDRDGARALSRQNVGVSSTMSEVTKLQKELKAQGFYNGPVTGYFGTQTKAAVNAWQVAHKTEVLTPWGLTGPTGWFYQSSERWMNELKGCSDSVQLDNGVQLN